jgi:hypothetical protein
MGDSQCPRVFAKQRKQIGDAALQTVVEISKQSRLLDAMQRNDAAHPTIDLARCCLGLEGGTAVGQALRTNKTVKV